MLVELGPVEAPEVEQWTRFARRVLVELRSRPAELEGVCCTDWIEAWHRYLDEWANLARGRDTFRWSGSMEGEQAEFLLHGLVRCVRSEHVQAQVTDPESEAYWPFTKHVIEAFVDGLTAEGLAHEQYGDQIRASLLGGTLN